jgi:hypothetical protein
MPTRTDFPSQEKSPRTLLPAAGRPSQRLNRAGQSLGSAWCVLDRHPVKSVLPMGRGATEKDGISPLQLPTMED